MVNKVLLIGGNIIQYYMAKSLQERGFAIFYYDLYFPEKLIGVKEIQQTQELCDLMSGSECVVVFAEVENSVWIESRQEEEDTPFENKTDMSCLFWKPGKGIKWQLRETVAEAALVEAKLLSGKTVNGSKALVIGFGIYAEGIALLLRAWNASVVVVPDDEMEQRLADYREYDTCDRKRLTDFLEARGEKRQEQLDFVFQCSSRSQLRAKHICCLQPDTVLLNLTQDDSAVDMEYARFLQLQTKHCRNLLTEYAPAVTGRLLAEALLQDLRKIE